MGSLISKIGALIAQPALQKLREHFDPRLYNGAMLVGLNGICVKSHGGTDALGFAHAIEAGVKLIRQDFNEVIKQNLAYLDKDKSEYIEEKSVKI
jgi:glycerol-3-phosphate acyltransferase PlsX